MTLLQHAKTILEVAILALFLILLTNIWRTHGHDHALTLLTNKP